MIYALGIMIIQKSWVPKNSEICKCHLKSIQDLEFDVDYRDSTGIMRSNHPGGYCLRTFLATRLCVLKKNERANVQEAQIVCTVVKS